MTDSRTPDANLAGPNHHLPSLDGLRGLAVVFVLVFHVFQAEPVPGSGLARLAYLSTRVGQTGVDLFFVLSGFLITGILYDTKGTAGYFRNFYGRRSVRIFPLYFGVLIIATIILPLIVGHRVTDANPWALWTFTANLAGTFGHEPVTFGHYWTLAVEEQFYFIWPAVVFALARPALMRVCVGWIIGSILVRAGLLRVGLPVSSFTLGRLDSLAMGGLLALAARGPLGMAGWRDRAWVALAGMAAVMGPLYVIKTGSHEAWLQAVKFTLLAFLYGGLLVLAVTSSTEGPVGRFFRHPALRTSGRYSYGIYVLHPFLMSLFHADWASSLLAPLGETAAIGVRSAIIIALSYVAGGLSYHLFEKHFLTLKRYFEYETRPAPTSVESADARAGIRGLAAEG